MLHVLSLEHCPNITDEAFVCDKPLQLQDVNLGHCVALTDVGILRLVSCSPRLQVLSMSAPTRSFPVYVYCSLSLCSCTFQSVAAAHLQRKYPVLARSLPLPQFPQHSILVQMN